MHHAHDPSRRLSTPRRSECTIRRAVIPVTALVLGIAALATPSLRTPVAAQEALSIGIDASVEDNGPLSLGDIDSCVSVSRGDVFDVDLFIRNVEDLLAWEVYIEYDPDVLALKDRNVDMFLGSNAGSSVLDVSGRLADAEGLYRTAAADTSDPPTPDSGSGVLARLSFRALAPGDSQLDLIVRDVDGDGLADQGPLLRDVDAVPLGDTSGDTIFDGPIENATVAVHTACEGAGPGRTGEADSSDSGPSTGLIVAIAVGGAAAALVAVAFVALRVARRSNPPTG